MKSLLFVTVGAVVLVSTMAQGPPDRIGELPGPMGGGGGPPSGGRGPPGGGGGPPGGGGGPPGPMTEEVRKIGEGIAMQGSIGIPQSSGFTSSRLNERGGDRGGDRGGERGNHDRPPSHGLV